MNNQIYFENFTCVDDVIKEYCISEKEMQNVEIIYAAYNTPDYEGYSQVIFIRDRKLYEVNGSHCSCSGLEGQWLPEETTLAALMFRPNVEDGAKKNLKERFHNLIAFL